ncbi:MAG: PQQ-binding-like beta-propeller repeat protein [Gemmataceae bacterium]
MVRSSLALLVLPLALVALDHKPTGWPLFRGNTEQNGVAASQLPDRLDVLWTFKAEDSIENAVAVAGDLVFVASMDEHLYAVELSGGKPRWKQKVAPFKAAPVVRDGLVFAGDLDGNFHCLDAAKGIKRWTYEAGSEVGGANFHKDKVLFASHDEHLYCVTKEGKLAWKFRTDGPIYGAPAVADGKTFVVGCDSMMHVLDVERGKELSSVNLEGQTGATAGVLGDHLYVGTMSNEVKAIDWKMSAVVWRYKAGRQSQAYYSSPAVTQKYVVIGSRDNKVHCLDRAMGTAAWSFPTGNKVDSSPVVAGSKVVVGSQDGKLYVLDLETGKSLQNVPLDGPINASPAVVEGKVLIGTQKGTLYCLGAKK